MSDARTVIAATEIKVTDGDDGHIVIALGPDAADAILAALAEAGLVIVPRTCTEKMAEAYDSIDFRRQAVACYGVLEQAKDVWNVMVEAANEQ